MFYEFQLKAFLFYILTDIYYRKNTNVDWWKRKCNMFSLCFFLFIFSFAFSPLTEARHCQFSPPIIPGGIFQICGSGSEFGLIRAFGSRSDFLCWAKIHLLWSVFLKDKCPDSVFLEGRFWIRLRSILHRTCNSDIFWFPKFWKDRISGLFNIRILLLIHKNNVSLYACF